MTPKSEDSFFQKLARGFAICCGAGTLICVLILLVYFDDLSKVYRASFASGAFFFFTAGVVLKEIAITNLRAPIESKPVEEEL